MDRSFIVGLLIGAVPVAYALGFGLWGMWIDKEYYREMAKIERDHAKELDRLLLRALGLESVHLGDGTPMSDTRTGSGDRKP